MKYCTMIKLHIILGICKEIEYKIEDNKLIENFNFLIGHVL